MDFIYVKCIVLLSDGIDSPVAYYIMSRKMDCIAVHFVMNKKEKIESIMKLLKGKIYFIPYKKIEGEILKVKDAYRCIICKRFMYRIAEKIADMENAKIIVTGENLGQVASQTLENLNSIEQAVSIPIVRPLIAMDKEEIINIAKKIGTYEISIKNAHKCKIAPKKPVTRALVERVLNEEKKVNVDAINDALKNAKIEKF